MRQAWAHSPRLAERPPSASLGHLPDFLERTFARQHHQVAAQFPGKFHPGRARDGHLRRSMDGKIRRQPPDQTANANVLDDGGIDARRNQRSQITLRIGHLIGEDQRVERHITLDAAPVQKLHQLRQFSLAEIIGPHPRIEPFQAEVNGVRAVFDRGFGALPIARRGEQFRAGRRRTKVVRGFRSWLGYGVAGHLRS
jgi:hypothetical protein